MQGAMQLRRSFPAAVFIFVMPPSLEALWDRLAGRGTEGAEEVARRMAFAKGEIAMSQYYDFIIVNDQIERARAQLRAVIEASRVRAPHMKKFVEEVLHGHA